MTDILIVGGGPSGLAAAIALAERGVSVLVVDAAGGVSAQRGELVSQGAGAILERLGLDDVINTAVVIEDVVSRWGKAQLQSHGGHPSLGLHGWGVDRQTLSQAMVRRVQTLGIRVLTARVTAHQKIGDGWRVKLHGTLAIETINARFLIDATGRPASIARRLGATLLPGKDLVAVTWQTPNSAPAKVLAEATPKGWWYSAPHRGGSTLGFVTSAQCAKKISRTPTDFLSTAQDGLNLIVVAGEPAKECLYDSRSSVLDRMSGPGWLATGDAAASFDPIASQGLFNALSGGFFAGHAAADAIAGDKDAPLVYEALATRTAERTFAMTHLQYAAMPYDTLFWRQRCRPTLQPQAASLASPLRES